jgi:hypothetical protein
MEPRALRHLVTRTGNLLFKAVIPLPFVVVLAACATATSSKAPSEVQPRDSVSTCESLPLTKTEWALPAKATKQLWSDCYESGSAWRSPEAVFLCPSIPLVPVMGAAIAGLGTPMFLTIDLLTHRNRCPAGEQTETDAESNTGARR